MTKYLIPNIWSGKPDDSPGIGHEFRNWLTGYNIADYYKLKFVHSPFAGDHVVPPDKWYTVGRVDVPVKQWESFLNFGKNELTIEDLPKDIKTIQLPRIGCHTNVSSHQFDKIINNHYNENILFKCPFNQFLSMRWSIYYSNRFKNKYWEKRKVNPITTPFVTNQLGVGVHIRRCDVNPKRYPDRFIPNLYYKTVLEKLLSIDSNIDIHIYSDAKDIKEFPELIDIPNTSFHLRTDVFETFHSLVVSDICVMSHGSWAILVAHLNRGVKITMPWNDAWNKFLTDKDIVPTNKNGNFDPNVLGKAIERNIL
jgi:hypothetical protein